MLACELALILKADFLESESSQNATSTGPIPTSVLFSVPIISNNRELQLF